MRVIFFGTYNVKTTPRIQVLIEGLQDKDAEVVECNAPLPLTTADRVSILKKPWKVPILLLAIARCWLKLIFKARGVGRADLVIVGHLGQFDIHLAHWIFHKTPIALDYMVSGSEAAVDRGLATKWKARLLKIIDDAALKIASIIIVDTEEHKQDLPYRFREKGRVILVGASRSWFEAGERASKAKKQKGLRKRPSIIFFGNYTPLQGVPVIARALVQLDRPVDVTMVGRGQDYAEVREIIANNPNKNLHITWIDWVDADELPDLVARHDICLGIFGTGPKAEKVIPNKVYQGLAAGCIVVTSETVSQKRIMGDRIVYSRIGDYKDLMIKIRRYITKPDRATQSAGRFELRGIGDLYKEFNPIK